jgi:G3E family GTPase
MKSSIPLAVICGFLGSGKTTLLRRWRRHESLQDAAVIVQDLSEVGMDAELVSDEGALPAIGELRQGVAALHGRHAREDLHVSMGLTLEKIANLEPLPPLVLVESTGAARPWPLLRAVTQHPRFYLRHFLVTMDALNLHRDFEDAAILEDPSQLQDMALQTVAYLMLEQAAFANVIILTKVDLVPKPSMQSMIQRLQKHFPNAAVALSAQAGLLLEQLDGVAAPDMAELARMAVNLPEGATMEAVESEEFRSARPFHPQRLWECCREHMGTGLYRTKGFLWLASRPGEVLLWQQAGSQITLEFTGLWRAELALNREGKLQPEEVAYLQGRVAALDPVFGDRHIELVLIGQEASRRAFADRLQTCLCSDEEVTHWQQGGGFTDPWPKVFGLSK